MSKDVGPLQSLSDRNTELFASAATIGLWTAATVTYTEVLGCYYMKSSRPLRLTLFSISSILTDIQRQYSNLRPAARPCQSNEPFGAVSKFPAHPISPIVLIRTHDKIFRRVGITPHKPRDCRTM